MCRAIDLRHMTIEAVLTTWPATVEVFMTLNLACIGCSFVPYCTVEEAVLLHRLDSESFLTRLERNICVEKANDDKLPDSSN